jgi:predicted CXXCH cytochrome family protein
MGRGSIEFGANTSTVRATGWQTVRSVVALGQFGRSTFAHAVQQGVFSFLLVLACADSSQAKTHPVPLEPGTDAAKCITCHEDKTKGKAVHAAATGCLSCHEVRVNKDVTRIKLTAVTPFKLCLQCHADKDASQIKGLVHSPAVRDCLKCHDPHTSAVKNQLLKPTDGAAKDSNLCSQCHTTGLNVPATGSRHAALDGGCETCHVTHKTGPSASAEFKYQSPESSANTSSTVSLFRSHSRISDTYWAMNCAGV